MRQLPLIFFSGILLSSCATTTAPEQTQTTRIVEGKTTNTRYVSPEAYAHYLHAEICISNQQWTEAISQLKLALVFDPQSAYLHQTLADVYVRLGNLAEADEHLSRAIQLSPDDPGLRSIKAKVSKP